MEPPSLARKPEGDIGASSPFLQSNPNGRTQRRRGRPKKQVVADHAANPTSLSAVRRDFSSAHSGERTPQ